MSKKDRLKAQKQKQDILRKEQEEQERLEKEEAKLKQSKAARKLRRKAKRSGMGDPIICIILKILMVIPFGYSGFFYGGVLVAGVFGGYIEPHPPEWVGWCALAGVILIGAGILIAFFRKYIISFIVICAGTGVFLKAAGYMIDKIQYRLENYKVDEAFENMDKQYMTYYYPIAAVAGISLILMIISLIRRYIRRKRIRYEKDTAPVDSIVKED